MLDPMLSVRIHFVLNRRHYQTDKLKIVRKEIATQDAANRSAYMRKITLGCYWEASQQPAINLIVLNAHHY